MIFDLTVPFWLSRPRSRIWAYSAANLFHGLTGLLFNIGMFPWIMIACTLVFFDWRTREGRLGPLPQSGRKAALLVVFLLVQLLLPLRNCLLAGDVNWTEEGGRFAWRVMLVEKTGHATFYVRDLENGREWLVLPSDYLTPFQEQQMVFQPDMIMAFARHIAGQYRQPVAIRVEAYVSWNGRSSRLLLDPEVNLLQAGRAPLLPEPDTP